MFPIPWNFPFRKKNGNVVNIEDAISGGGGGGSDLPSYDSGDAGKILGVDDNGDLEWSDKVEDLTTSVETIETNLGSITESVEGLEEDLTNEVVTRGSLGAKNLLPNEATTQTINGVTYTVNADGSVTANGTRSDWNPLTVCENLKLQNGTYIISGLSDNVHVIVFDNTDNQPIGESSGDDIDDSFTIDSSNVNHNISVLLVIRTLATVTNETVYPMIRLATDSDPTYQPYSMTNRELTPIAQAVSNRNLLDNPWFTVNQRGQSSYTAQGYTVDRWYSNTEVTVTIGDGYLTIPANGSFKQNLEINRLVDGKTYTFSVMTNDGNIYSMTGVLKISASGWQLNKSFITNYLWAGIQVGANGTLWDIRITSENGIAIKAVKLELGTVSTLHMDTAPNYAEELLKCQRYFVAIPESSSFRISMAVNQTPYVVDTTIPLPVAMRAKPSIVDNGVELDITSLDGAGFAGTSWSIPSLPTSAEYSYVVLRVAHNNGLQVGDGTIYVYNKNLELSADL